MDVSLTVSTTSSIIFVGLLVLVIVLIEHLFNKWIQRSVQYRQEVIYDYPRSSNVVNGEDEIAARTVKMTANPSYGIAMCSKFALSQGNCHDRLRLHPFPVSRVNNSTYGG